MKETFKNQNARKLANPEQTALLDELISKSPVNSEAVANTYNGLAEKMKWPTITTTVVSKRKRPL